MSRFCHQSKGFTIIELIVVITIIGILAGVSIVSYVGVNQKAIAASLQSDLIGASTQLKLFQVDNDQYPTANNCPTIGSKDICLKTSSGNLFEGYAPNNSVSPQTFSLVAKNTLSSSKYIITNSAAPTVYLEPVKITLSYTGSYQDHVVPVGINSIVVEAWGAQGGEGGKGGYVKGTIAVTPGETLRIYVGGQGLFNDYCNKAVNKGAGYNGGGGANCYGMGGGGASDVRRSPYGLVYRLMVAGGGGGRGVEGASGGIGGGLIGGSGFGGSVPNGTGGTQLAGGTVSTGSGNGSLGQGGYQTLYHLWGGSGGGGGGYYGGASGGDPVGGTGGGGGGGSSYAMSTATNVIYTAGDRSGNGLVILTE